MSLHADLLRCSLPAVNGAACALALQVLEQPVMARHKRRDILDNVKECMTTHNSE